MPLVSTSHNRQNRAIERPRKPILRGNFPKTENYRELAVYKLNRMLTIALCSTILIAVCAYSAVIACEFKLQDLHKATVALNYENAEIQNLVDKAKSYSSIDKKLVVSNTLKAADKVIEVDSVAPKFNPGPRRRKFYVNSVIGY